MHGDTYHPPVPALKDAALSDVAMTQNIWVTVLEEKNVRVRLIAFKQDTAQEDLEVKITTENGIETLTQTAVAATPYFIMISYGADNTSNFTITATPAEITRQAFMFECRSLKIEIRKTTAAGANKTACVVNHSIW